MLQVYDLINSPLQAPFLERGDFCYFYFGDHQGGQPGILVLWRHPEKHNFRQGISYENGRATKEYWDACTTDDYDAVWKDLWPQMTAEERELYFKYSL